MFFADNPGGMNIGQNDDTYGQLRDFLRLPLWVDVSVCVTAGLALYHQYKSTGLSDETLHDAGEPCELTSETHPFEAYACDQQVRIP